MPSAETGTQCTAMAPTEPKKPVDSMNGDAGKVTDYSAKKRQATGGSEDSVPVKRYTKPASNSLGAEPTDEETTGWVGLVLADEDGNPVAGESYAITLPDGSVAEGTTDADGGAKISGFVPGSCKLSFPRLDQDAWE